MLSLKVRSGGWMALLALALPAWAAEATLESVEKTFTAAAEQIKAIAFKITMGTDITYEGGSAKQDSVTNYEYLRTGERTKFRDESKHRGVTKFGEQEMKQ